MVDITELVDRVMEWLKKFQGTHDPYTDEELFRERVRVDLLERKLRLIERNSRLRRKDHA